MEFSPVKPDLVRYEMRMVQGQNPTQRETKVPGGFGRFLSGMGRVLGSVAMPLSFLFPPAAIGAAGMYGVGAIGDQVQGRAYAKEAERIQREQATVVSFPGLDVGHGGLQPAAARGSNPADAQVMDVLFTSNNAMMHNAQGL